MVLTGYPGALSSLTLAYVLSPEDGAVDDSAALRWRAQVGAASEITLVAGSVREEALAGGSIETAWLEAGWRLEGIAFRPRDGGETETFAIAGVDHRFAGGLLVLAELYHNTLGATREAELAEVVQTTAFAEGRLLQLSRRVLALGASTDFAGLWTVAYTVFGAALRDAGGERHASTLQQLTFTYSVSDNAEAVLSLTTGTGRGLTPAGGFRSEFGHVPDALYVSVQLVL